MHSMSLSTYSDDFKLTGENREEEFSDHESDSESLTANDFELLNSENFFDKINDAFQ